MSDFDKFVHFYHNEYIFLSWCESQIGPSALFIDPLTESARDVLGAYSQSGGDGRSLVTLASFAYNNGYSGALTWQATGAGQHADSLATQKTALNALKHKHDQNKGGQVMLSLSNPQPRGNILSVVGKELRLRGMKVFMSGMNLAWYHFGMDFGNGRYDCCTGSTLEDYLRNISASGGNSIRKPT